MALTPDEQEKLFSVNRKETLSEDIKHHLLKLSSDINGVLTAKNFLHSCARTAKDIIDSSDFPVQNENVTQMIASLENILNTDIQHENHSQIDIGTYKKALSDFYNNITTIKDKRGEDDFMHFLHENGAKNLSRNVEFSEALMRIFDVYNHLFNLITDDVPESIENVNKSIEARNAEKERPGNDAHVCAYNVNMLNECVGEDHAFEISDEPVDGQQNLIAYYYRSQRKIDISKRNFLGLALPIGEISQKQWAYFGHKVLGPISDYPSGMDTFNYLDLKASTEKQGQAAWQYFTRVMLDKKYLTRKKP